MPEAIKSRNFHDIVLLCDPCHRNYENTARDLKEQIAEQYKAPLDGKGDVFDFPLHYAKKAASAICMFRDKLPADVLKKKTDEIASYLGHEPSENEIENLSMALTHDMTNHRRHGEIVIEKVEDLQSFVEMWRFHFLENMKPQFMPDGWNPKRKCDDVGKGRRCTDEAK